MVAVFNVQLYIAARRLAVHPNGLLHRNLLF